MVGDEGSHIIGGRDLKADIVIITAIL